MKAFIAGHLRKLTKDIEHVAPEPAVAEDEPGRARDRVGVDVNLPIRRNGALAEQVADPRIIARTGAGWVRLNFVLGPWSAVTDETVYLGHTWQEAYARIIKGFRGQGLRIYGLIGAEVIGSANIENTFRQPPPVEVATHTWIEQYVDTFVTVLKMFCSDVEVVEGINEPDDWHNATCNWIHPEWFAIILQRLYEAVKPDPVTGHVKLVSGPVQGLEANNNAGVRYLVAAYRAGIRRFGWGSDDTPFPFDAVGYHIYVEEDMKEWPVQKDAIRSTYCRDQADVVN